MLYKNRSLFSSFWIVGIMFCFVGKTSAQPSREVIRPVPGAPKAQLVPTPVKPGGDDDKSKPSEIVPRRDVSPQIIDIQEPAKTTQPGKAEENLTDSTQKAALKR